MEKQKENPTVFSLQFPWDQKENQTQDIRMSTGPVRTCENKSPLVVLILSSICSQFILVVCHVTKGGKGNPVQSFSAWLSLRASYPDTNKFWCSSVYSVPLGFNIKKHYAPQTKTQLKKKTNKKNPTKPKTTQQAKKKSTYWKHVYTPVLPEKSKSNLADTFYFFTPPSPFLSIRMHVSTNKYWGHFQRRESFLFHNAQNQKKIWTLLLCCVKNKIPACTE